MLSTADLLLLGHAPYVLPGLILGGLLGLAKFTVTSFVFTYLLSGDKSRRSAPRLTAGYILCQLLVLPVLAVSLLTDIWFFAGTAAGILSVPFVILINGLTEGLGITGNNFC